MGQLALPLMIVGTLVQAAGTIAQGNAANAQAKYEAKQLEQRAGQERAAAQREAIEKRRRSTLIQSRQQALAAASGAGATDPTVVDLIADTEAEGEYQALGQLFLGEERARGAEGQAAARRMEGRLAKRASRFGALSTIASGVGGTLLQKYG